MFVSGITQEAYNELIESIHCDASLKGNVYVYVDRENESLRFIGNSLDFFGDEFLFSGKKDEGSYQIGTIGS